jgi:hypothetical protein
VNISASDLAAALLAKVEAMRERQATIVLAEVKDWPAYQRSLGYLECARELGDWIKTAVRSGEAPGVE